MGLHGDTDRGTAAFVSQVNHAVRSSYGLVLCTKDMLFKNLLLEEALSLQQYSVADPE